MSKCNTIHHRIIKLRHPLPEIKHPPQHRFRIRYCVLAVILAFASCCRTYETSASSHATCTDIEFIFARGSGEGLNSDTYRAWKDSLQDELKNELNGQLLTYHFYELGSSSQQGSQYPAVRIAGDLEGIINLGGAAISGGESHAFGESVTAGVTELKAYIEKTISACPKTKFVLGGYSQGAMVLTHSLPSLNTNHIIYVATFGDPKLYLPEGAHPQQDAFYVPEACYGLNLSEYRAYVPDCYAYAGVLGAAIPYQPLGYSGKLGTWCNQNDIMCSSGLSIQDHTSYVSAQLYRDAARRIIRAIKSAFVDRLDYDFANDQHVHEVAIVADITGSMARGDLYWRLTREAENLARKVIATGGRVSYFVYRDLIDGVVTQRLCDFTCTLDELKDAINSVELKLGEDDDESALSAMNYAINALNWSNNSEKSLLILTDAGLHEPDRDGTTSTDVITSSKVHGGVKIYAPVWREYMDEYKTVAEQTGGQVLNLGAGIEKVTAAILPNPIINLAQSHYEGPDQSHFIFDASSSQVFSGPNLTYDWDLDGNGLYELQNAGPIVEKTFSRFEGDIFVRATDRAGHNTVASIYVKAQGKLQPLPLTEITDVNFETTGRARTGSTASIDFSTDADRVLLTTDEAILGFIDVADGRGYVTVEDVELISELRLVPYSKAGHRGISYTISLQNNIGTHRPSPPESHPDLPTVSTPSTSSSEVADSQSFILPKAPNTGVRKLSKKEANMSQP